MARPHSGLEDVVFRLYCNKPDKWPVNSISFLKDCIVLMVALLVQTLQPPCKLCSLIHRQALSKMVATISINRDCVAITKSR